MYNDQRTQPKAAWSVYRYSVLIKICADRRYNAWAVVVSGRVAAGGTAGAGRSCSVHVGRATQDGDGGAVRVPHTRVSLRHETDEPQPLVHPQQSRH